MNAKFQINLTIEQCAVIVRALREQYHNDIRMDNAFNPETGELNRENTIRCEICDIIDPSHDIKNYRP